MNKSAEYKKLVDERKLCRRCQSLGLTNPAEIESGRFDSEQIGPWSRWQGNLNAPLMVVGQDWGGIDYFVESNKDKDKGRDKRDNPTDLNLIKLVKIADFLIQDVYLPEGQNVLFFTNAILCLKQGKLSDNVSDEDRKARECFKNCESFLRRQIEIVNPAVVVGLGKHAYQAILSGFNLKAGKFSEEVEEENGRELLNGIHVFAVYHCGKKSTNMNRPMEAQKKDWMRIRKFIEATQAKGKTC